MPIEGAGSISSSRSVNRTGELAAGVGVVTEPDEAPSASGSSGHLDGVGTMSVRMCGAARQPTIRRLNASTMKHTYAIPDRVGVGQVRDPQTRRAGPR